MEREASKKPALGSKGQKQACLSSNMGNQSGHLHQPSLAALIFMAVQMFHYAFIDFLFEFTLAAEKNL